MAGPNTSPAGGFRGYFEWFVHSEVTGSVLLLACTVAALGLANSPLAESYDHLLHTKIGISWGESAFKLSLHHWINDGLMVIFFFVVGLEIKREIVLGQLSSVSKATLPVAAAAGGMLVPAALYFILNPGGEASAGWGIPMATDIAFALGVLAIFGKRVPLGLKVFLTALAIADDLGAVLVIAIFYTESINLGALAAAGILLVLLLVALRFRVRRLGLLLPIIAGIWLGVFASGIHATVAGILVSLVIPVRARIEPGLFLESARRRLERLEASPLTTHSMIDDQEQFEVIESIKKGAEDMLPAGLRLEHILHPVQVWFILPVFALANAAVTIDRNILEALRNPVSLGIILGLAVGKPIGICLLSWLATRFAGGTLPAGVTWPQLAGTGCLAGIGFTMSLFISDLAFSAAHLETNAKVGILAASLLSAIVGIVILSRTLPARGEEPA